MRKSSVKYGHIWVLRQFCPPKIGISKIFQLFGCENVINHSRIAAKTTLAQISILKVAFSSHTRSGNRLFRKSTGKNGRKIAKKHKFESKMDLIYGVILGPLRPVHRPLTFGCGIFFF